MTIRHMGKLEMLIKKGVIVSYRIVFGLTVVGRGIVIDPLNFGFVIEPQCEAKQVDKYRHFWPI